MTRLIFATSALLASVSLASAMDLGFEGGLGGNLAIGGSAGFSENHGSLSTSTFGNGNAKATSEGYALQEGDFRSNWKGNGHGGDIHHEWNAAGSLNTAAGSLATTKLQSTGNGGGAASSFNQSSAGGISGGVSLGGSAGIGN